MFSGDVDDHESKSITTGAALSADATAPAPSGVVDEPPPMKKVGAGAGSSGADMWIANDGTLHMGKVGMFTDQGKGTKSPLKNALQSEQKLLGAGDEIDPAGKPENDMTIEEVNEDTRNITNFAVEEGCAKIRLLLASVEQNINDECAQFTGVVRKLIREQLRLAADRNEDVKVLGPDIIAQTVSAEMSRMEAKLLKKLETQMSAELRVIGDSMYDTLREKNYFSHSREKERVESARKAAEQQTRNLVAIERHEKLRVMAEYKEVKRSLQNEINDLLMQLATAQQALQNQLNDMTQLNEIARLKSDIERQEKTVLAKDERISNLEQLLQNVQSELQDAYSAQVPLREKIVDLETIITEIKAESQRLRDNLFFASQMMQGGIHVSHGTTDIGVQVRPPTTTTATDVNILDLYSEHPLWTECKKLHEGMTHLLEQQIEMDHQITEAMDMNQDLQDELDDLMEQHEALLERTSGRESDLGSRGITAVKVSNSRNPSISGDPSRPPSSMGAPPGAGAGAGASAGTATGPGAGGGPSRAASRTVSPDPSNRSIQGRSRPNSPEGSVVYGLGKGAGRPVRRRGKQYDKERLDMIQLLNERHQTISELMSEVKRLKVQLGDSDKYITTFMGNSEVRLSRDGAQSPTEWEMLDPVYRVSKKRSSGSTSPSRPSSRQQSSRASSRTGARSPRPRSSSPTTGRTTPASAATEHRPPSRVAVETPPLGVTDARSEMENPVKLPLNNVVDVEIEMGEVVVQTDRPSTSMGLRPPSRARVAQRDISPEEKRPRRPATSFSGADEGPFTARDDGPHKPGFTLSRVPRVPPEQIYGRPRDINPRLKMYLYNRAEGTNSARPPSRSTGGVISSLRSQRTEPVLRQQAVVLPQDAAVKLTKASTKPGATKKRDLPKEELPKKKTEKGVGANEELNRILKSIPSAQDGNTPREARKGAQLGTFTMPASAMEDDLNMVKRALRDNTNLNEKVISRVPGVQDPPQLPKYKGPQETVMYKHSKHPESAQPHMDGVPMEEMDVQRGIGLTVEDLIGKTAGQRQLFRGPSAGDGVTLEERYASYSRLLRDVENSSHHMMKISKRREEETRRRIREHQEKIKRRASSNALSLHGTKPIQQAEEYDYRNTPGLFMPTTELAKQFTTGTGDG